MIISIDARHRDTLHTRRKDQIVASSSTIQNIQIICNITVILDIPRILDIQSTPTSLLYPLLRHLDKPLCVSIFQQSRIYLCHPMNG